MIKKKHTDDETSGLARKEEENTLMQYIHAKHEIARKYLGASFAYPVRLGVLLGVPAELEDCDEDSQGQPANQHDKDTTWKRGKPEAHYFIAAGCLCFFSGVALCAFHG